MKVLFLTPPLKAWDSHGFHPAATRMQYILLSFSILFLPFCSFAEGIKETTELQPSKQEFQNDIPDGGRKTYHANGKIKTVEFYKNGKGNGTFITYDEEGNVQEIRNFKDNLLDGRYTAYYPNGQVEIEANFIDGEDVGISYGYLDDGTLMRETQHDDKGQFVLEKLFDKTGNVLSEINPNIEDQKQMGGKTK